MQSCFDVYEVSVSKINIDRNLPVNTSACYHYIAEVYRISKNKEKQYIA